MARLGSPRSRPRLAQFSQCADKPWVKMGGYVSQRSWPGHVTRWRAIEASLGHQEGPAAAGGAPVTGPGEAASRPAASRSRERELASTLVMLAGGLAEDYDLADLLGRLTEACVRLLGATAAALLLNDQRGQ